MATKVSKIVGRISLLMNALKKEKVTKLNSPYYISQEQKEKMLQRRRKGLIRRLTVFGILVAVVSYVMISTLFSQAAALDEKLKEKKRLQHELTELKKEQKLLEEEIVKLNDDEYIAKIARRDYFLSKDGEIIFNIKESTDAD
jgi:cell division protein DivIC